MNSRPHPPADDAVLRAEAARWTVRRDRGLSAAEAIEFELWLAADPRHDAALRRATGAWSRLDRIPENVAAPVLATQTRRHSFWRRAVVAGSFAAAAAIAVIAFRFVGTTASSPSTAAPRQLALSDGTIVQLNTGGEVREQFTAGERRVSLVRGEAHFSVTKNPARPFVVHAGGVAVRAVGTAFNVHLKSSAVEVLVTEGRVGVERVAALASSTAAPLPAAAPLDLRANDRAIVALTPISPATAAVVTTANAEEIARALAWQEPLLRLRGSTLAEVAAEFERRTGRRIVLADPALGARRVGGRFRGDDPDGFASLIAATLELHVEHAADGTIVLREKNPSPR
jgi:transmembrane sensor